MRDDERLGYEESGREQHQQQPGRGDRQHLEPVEADDQRDRADGAGEDEARVPELDDDPDQADREHQRDDVRVDQQVEQALPRRQLDALDLRVGRRRDRQPLRLGRRAVDLPEEVRVVGRDHVDHVLLERLACAEVRRLRDHLARHLDVAAVLARELADVGGRVVDDLPAQILGDVLAADRHRRRGADVGLRRHREHVGGHADHGAGGVGARARRRDVDDHRHVRGEDPLHDRAHRRGEAARACPSRSRPRCSPPPRRARSRRGGSPASPG